MSSICLNHQDRPAEHRCSACLKPLCGECARRIGETVFCSQACEKRASESEARIAEHRSRDAEARELAARRARQATLMRLLVVVAVLGVLTLGLAMSWPYLPEGTRGMFLRFFRMIGL